MVVSPDLVLRRTRRHFNANQLAITHQISLLCSSRLSRCGSAWEPRCLRPRPALVIYTPLLPMPKKRRAEVVRAAHEPKAGMQASTAVGICALVRPSLCFLAGRLRTGSCQKALFIDCTMNANALALCCGHLHSWSSGSRRLQHVSAAYSIASEELRVFCVQSAISQ